MMGTCVADLCTRSELLDSTLPAPLISTSPSGLDQAEAARPSHPESVQAFDVAPIVQAYLAGLPATPERFKLPDDAYLTVQPFNILHVAFPVQVRVSFYINLT